MTLNDLTLWVELTEPERCDLALLHALQKEHPHLTRATLKEKFKKNQVALQDPTRRQPVLLSPSRILPVGRHALLVLEFEAGEFSPAEATPATSDFTLPVVYEDEDLLVIHKRSGVASLPHSSSENQTAVNFALAHFPGLRGVGPKKLEPGLLHRLDTETSGLLVFAKNGDEFERLRAAWQKGEVLKSYRAWVKATLPLPRLPLQIDLPLAHDARSSKRMVVFKDSTKIRGNPLRARTHILEAIQRRPESSLFDLYIRIETGVLHQIRCHLSSLGWPILGDRIYTAPPSSRLWLHAWRLSIPLRTGGALSLEADLPAGWNTPE